jgi:colanic acid/amylovoran biosynthesis glycosyltransferase
MKIAFLVRFFPKLSETFILNQITGLLDLGHEVDVFAEGPGGEAVAPPEIAHCGLANRIHYFDVPESLAARLVRVPGLLWTAARRDPALCGRVLNVRRHGAYALKLLYAIQPFLGRRFDVLQCHYGVMGNLGAALKRIGAGRRLVVMFHGTDVRDGVERGGALYAPVFREADAILAISRYNADNLLRFGAPPERLVRHPVGIEVSRIPERAAGRRAPPERVVILTVARLADVKGVDVGLRAAAALARRRPGLAIEYRVVGGGPRRAALEALARDLGLAERVRFAGALEHDAVLREMAAADLYLMPSRAEALPVALMEALCAGLPAVATRVGSTDEVLADGRAGCLVPPEDPEGMADALGRLLDEPQRWAEMGRRGRQDVLDRYDIRMLNERLAGIYRRLLADGGA